MITNTHIVLQ